MARVLIIDEMAIIRDPIAASLRMAGYQTNTACDGVEGLERARASVPDVIVLDVALGRMDGLSMVEAMRADEALKDTPVILLTAQADRDTVARAAHLGIKDYILKSRFSLDELLERVKRAAGVAFAHMAEKGKRAAGNGKDAHHPK